MEEGISLSFLIMEYSKADLYVYKSPDYDKNKMISEFVETINAKPNVRTVLTGSFS